MLDTKIDVVRSLSVAVVMCLVLAMPAAASALGWDFGTIDSSGDVGRFCDLQRDSLGNLHVVYLRNDIGTLKVASRIDGIWQTPETVDSSGAVDGHCGIAVASVGIRRVSYRRNDVTALWYAGPEQPFEWSRGDVIVSPDDIGGYLSLKSAPGNKLSLSCRNATQGSLIFLMRDSLGTWSAPDTVDPGPGRGTHSDHAYRPGVGYAFSEYASDGGMLMFADPLLHSSTWSFGTVSPNDIGAYLSLKNAPGNKLSLSCQDATQKSLVFLMRDSLGTWSAPDTVDPGPGRGTHSDHAYRPGVGYAFSEYASDGGMLMFADPLLHSSTWSFGTVSPNDIGAYLSLKNAPGNKLSLSCQDATQKSLVFLMRDSLGTWSAPDTVDPGPGRGTHSDHAYRPGVGYAFSEYASDGRMLMFADPVLYSGPWSIRTIYETGDAGRFISLAWLPNGRLAGTFYQYDAVSLGTILYMVLLEEFEEEIVRVVADSIGTSANDGVYVDLTIMPDWSWHISFLNTVEDALYYAYGDSSVLTGVENPDKPIPRPLVYKLHQNYPNPFNPQTKIIYSIPKSGLVKLSIYDVQGRFVRTLVNENKPAGEYFVSWDAKNDHGSRVASGVYFVRLVFDGRIQAKKMVLLK